RPMSGCALAAPTPAQAARLLCTTAEQVHAAVEGRSAPAVDLQDLHECTVDGCFVSLKRGGQLRSCCGIVAGPHPLPSALVRAAWRAACDDPRFPPISVTELDALALELHLLFDWQTCSDPAHARAAAVHVGRHGLVMRMGARAGLLLPAVAVEHGWDAIAFLRQTCAKAGLPTDAWQQETCQLECFQAHHLHCALQEALQRRDRPTTPDGQHR
ncbi:MAG: AmmeMemoRadiSam system protein A, partial [Planctomycetota bacterium]